MTCSRCDKPILPGEKFEEVDKFSPSGPGVVLQVHAKVCKRPYSQTTPHSIRH